MMAFLEMETVAVKEISKDLIQISKHTVEKEYLKHSQVLIFTSSTSKL
jgi:hypothetical protein